MTEMESYTHNLKIVLVDSNGNIVVDDEYLDEVKQTLCQLTTKKVHWNRQNVEITMKWHRKELTPIEQQFMGDLFSSPIYSLDGIILDHTRQIISSINPDPRYRILFHISRLIGDMIIFNVSADVI